ncbi:MAG TPA: excisionase family DNA-binding protein [Candidatus Acidoferrum sp.]|jgi:excisionase family DNA binding protein|nr:excisionase family DNA-binding protein [Candidatus Acidoferrum sp.]
MIEKALLSRKEAAEYVSLSLSTLDVAIARGMLRVRRMGSRVLIPREELDRFVRRDVPNIWPAKRDGQKTTRHAVI